MFILAFAPGDEKELLSSSEKQVPLLFKDTIISQSVGTFRTVKEISEPNAIQGNFPKKYFSAAALDQQSPLDEVNATKYTRPHNVYDIHANCGDFKKPGVGGLLYCAGHTCVGDPLLILKQHSIMRSTPQKIMQLILKRNIFFEEAKTKNDCLRQRVTFPARFDKNLAMAGEWDYGWDSHLAPLPDEPANPYLISCHCHSAPDNHREKQL